MVKLISLYTYTAGLKYTFNMIVFFEEGSKHWRGAAPYSNQGPEGGGDRLCPPYYYTVSEGKVFFFNLALTERNMLVKSDLTLSVYSFDLYPLNSTASKKKGAKIQ